VSLAARQMLIAVVFGFSVLVFVIRLSRRGQLSFRYTLGWTLVATLGILSGVFVWAVEPIAEGLGLSAAALLGLSALVFVTLIAIQLSISISGLQKQLRALVEDLARLRLAQGGKTLPNVREQEQG
jgi:hypothetical protein